MYGQLGAYSRLNELPALQGEAILFCERECNWRYFLLILAVLCGIMHKFNEF